MSQSRQLGAIMFADIMGFTAMMEENEAAASLCRSRLRNALKSACTSWNGRIVELTGDGGLCIFQSAYDAVRCAIAVQAEMKTADPIPLRIGIHSGDVVIDDNSVYGSVVNIASRVESFAVAGAIFITAKIFDEIKNQPDIQVQQMGRFKFKNVEDPVLIYAVSNPGITVPPVHQLQGKGHEVAEKKFISLQKSLIALAAIIGLAVFIYFRFLKQEGPLKLKSIAVMPFINQGNNPDNEFFSDGITEDIHTHLAKINSLNVIAHSAMMLYKNSEKSIKQIGKELNVSTILKGSVRRVGDKIRIYAELIDAGTSKNLWAETFDREYAKIFDIQSEIAQSIAQKMAINISAAEKNLIRQKPTDNLTAYENYLKGRSHYYEYKKEENEKAIEYFKKAIALDNNYALAWAGLGDAFSQKNQRFGYELSWNDSSKIAGLRAVSLDSNSSEAYKALANAYYSGGEYDKGFELLRRSVELNPNNEQAVGNLGAGYFLRAQLVEALRWEKKAAAINPKNGIPYQIIGWIYRLLGDYNNAEQWLKKSLALKIFSDTYRELGYTYLLQQKKDSAKLLVPVIIAIDSTNARNHETAGVLLQMAGDKQNAREHFQKAIDLNKSISNDKDAIAPIGLGQLLLEMNNKIDAEVQLSNSLSVFLKTIEEGSQDDDPPLNLAAIYAIKNDKQEAIKWFNKAVSANWLDYGFTDICPWFDNIRNEPAYKQQVTTVKKKIEVMRKKAAVY